MLASLLYVCTDASPQPSVPQSQPVLTSVRPASVSAVAMAAASTQTQDDSVDAPHAVPSSTIVTESGRQSVAHDAMRSFEPPRTKSVSDVAGQKSSVVCERGVTDWSCNPTARSSAVSVLQTTTSSSTAPSFIDRQTARVRPRILTHVIEGFVIQEANEPFPVGSLVFIL